MIHQPTTVTVPLSDGTSMTVNMALLAAKGCLKFPPGSPEARIARALRQQADERIRVSMAKAKLRKKP